MRKLLMLVTMLLVPALASAWTLPVKVTNTTAGIAAGNKATVTIGASSTDVTVGTKYFYPANTVTDVSVAIANIGNVTSITLDGATQPLTSPVTVTRGAASLHSLNIVYASVATAPKANVALTQTPGGLTTLSVGSSSTTSGYTGVAVGTAVTVKAQPSTGYSLTNIKVNDVVVATSSPYTFAVADTTADSVVATYAKTPVITAALGLATSGQVGTAVTATATASTTGTAPLTYAWTVNGAAAGTAATQSITPVAGANLVYVTVSSADAASVTKSATLQGVDALAATNYACTSCHSGSTPAVITAYNASGHKTAQVGCQTCHGSEAHAATPEQVAATCVGCHGDTMPANDPHVASTTNCISCHSLAVSASANADIDNDGVRAIIPEFEKLSHHITGGTPTAAQCKVCHLEGTGNTHMNGQIDLRNADDDSAFVWTGFEHTAMDNFCMSCHDADGATSAGVAAVLPTATAMNPFADTLTNTFDTVTRPRVIDVKSQFDPNNYSHHAVRGKKYTTRVSNGLFDASKGQKTLYEAGLFVADYTPLGEALPVADDSLLHCGDCHTVGQWRNNQSAKYDKGAIGAHGSENAYMLRNSLGTDALHGKTTYVCMNCHSDAAVPAVGKGKYYSTSVGHFGKTNCLNTDSTAKPVTTADLEEHHGTTTQSRLSGEANITGMTCISCHNSGLRQGWGGIHGGNATYTDGTGVTQSTYRFLPGMGNYKYKPAANVMTGVDGGTGNIKSAAGTETGSCYTNSNGELYKNGDPAQGVANDWNTGWSGCTHHGGTVADGNLGGTTFQRRSSNGNVGRPLSY